MSRALLAFAGLLHGVTVPVIPAAPESSLTPWWPITVAGYTTILGIVVFTGIAVRALIPWGKPWFPRNGALGLWALSLLLMLGGAFSAWGLDSLHKHRSDDAGVAWWATYVTPAEERYLADMKEEYGVDLSYAPSLRLLPDVGPLETTAVFPDGHSEDCEITRTAVDAHMIDTLACPSALSKTPDPGATS